MGENAYTIPDVEPVVNDSDSDEDEIDIPTGAVRMSGIGYNDEISVYSFSSEDDEQSCASLMQEDSSSKLQ